MVADKAEAYCPRLEGLAPWFLRSRNCLDTCELLNNFASSDFTVKKFSPRRTQRGCAATEIETEIITTKVAKSTKEEIEM